MGGFWFLYSLSIVRTLYSSPYFLFFSLFSLLHPRPIFQFSFFMLTLSHRKRVKTSGQGEYVHISGQTRRKAGQLSLTGLSYIYMYHTTRGCWSRYVALKYLALLRNSQSL